MRSTGVAYILWLFLGAFGAHRFYCNRIGTGILWLLTGGLLGIGWLIDIFLVPSMVREANTQTYFEMSMSQKYRPPYSGAQPTPAAPMAPPLLNNEPLPDHRIIFCTACGGALQVPIDAVGQTFGCPSCRKALIVPPIE